MKYYYDFHIHSALSPCGDDDMTPNNIVNMAMLNGLDIIALSDHNCCKNVRVTAELAARAGLVFLPGMELETAEEIHILCLFENADAAERFDREAVLPALPPVKNNEEIFGRQQIFDTEDNEVDTDPRFLINATTITVNEIAPLVKKYGGVAVPAHIDKDTKSLISVLGMTDESLGFHAYELSKNAPDGYEKTQFSLKGLNCVYVHDSDAHYLYDIAEAGGKNFIEAENKPSPREILRFLGGN